MKICHLMWGTMFSLILFIAITAAQAEKLFNEQDLSGWTSGQSPWVVENGVLKNTGVGNDNDFLHYNTQFPAGPFVFEIRMRMVSCTNNWPRPRIYFSGRHDYFGNEGSARQYEIYGNNLTNVQEVGNDAYSVGEWYTLRLEVNSQNKVSFFKDAVLTHTGVLTQRFPTDITLTAGDGWSGGKIEISSITYEQGHTLAITADGRSEINFVNDALTVKEITWGRPTNFLVDGVPQTLTWEGYSTIPISFPLSGEYWIKKVSGRDGGYAVQTAEGFFLGIIDNPNGSDSYNFELRRTPEEKSTSWMRVNTDGGLPFGTFDMTGQPGFTDTMPMGTAITFSGTFDGTNEFIFRNGKLVIKNLSWGPSISNFAINGQAVPLVWTNGQTQEIALTLPGKFQFAQTMGRCAMYPAETADGFVWSLADETGGGDSYAWKIVATSPALFSNFLYTVSDDFIVNVYHNGVLVPLQQRTLLSEIFGATGEKINLPIREGDWVVFNVVNNILRWNGSYFFAVAGMIDTTTLGFTTKFPAVQWSYCDDPSLVNEFIQQKDFLSSNFVKRIENPWSDGKPLMQSYVPEWNGDPIWGDADQRNIWIKFKAFSVISGDVNLDGRVDVGDLGILAANYGRESGSTRVMGDLNGDEKVDVSDLGILAANYGYGTSGGSNYTADAKAIGLTAESPQKESASSTKWACPATGFLLLLSLAALLLMNGWISNDQL